MLVDEYIKTCDEVYHTTLDPKGPGVIRIHLIPPKKKLCGIPWVTILNGYYILPLQTSWAILLKIFIEKVNETNGNPCDSIDELIDSVIKEAKKIFTKTEEKYIKNDLKEIIDTFNDIARGKNPDSLIGFNTIAKYSKFMSAPHRLDLMISSMEKNGKWNCNQKCVHCYAANEKMSNVNELSTEEWKKIIDKAREANIPMITFTGGEPTLREDLVELIDYSRWFVTRLNTNGVLLSDELCQKLYNASLDSVQITFYSSDEKIHNLLVGANNYNKTVEGIKNAVKNKLDISINTPLCSLNKDYKETVEFLSNLGVKYFTCSGLIPTGNASESESEGLKLSKDEITGIVKKAYNFAKKSFTSKNEIDIQFTSPGWIDDNELNEMHMNVPSCGACMSNMAIAPDGTVLPCQSWLFEDGLGNLLTDDFKKIWESKKCKKRRKISSKSERKCPLKEEHK